MTTTIAELDVEIETLQAVFRPAWAVGLTNQELVGMARQEGLNPYYQEWGDAIDSTVVKEARDGAFRDPRHVGVTELKRQRADIRKTAKVAAKAARRRGSAKRQSKSSTTRRRRQAHTMDTATAFKPCTTH